MSLVLADVGLGNLLSWMLASSGDAVVLHLYSNNYTPLHSSTAGNFTECTFGGYAAVTLSQGTWNTPVLVSDTAVTSYGSAPLAWTATNSQTVYGYYVVDQGGSNVLLWGELFGTSRTLNASDVIQLGPQFTLQSVN
jgi:hypothetical protein